MRARPQTIDQAIERTRAEIHEPLKTTGLRAVSLGYGPGEASLAAELRRHAQRRLGMLLEGMR